MKTESDYPPNLHTALSRPPRSPLVASKVLASSITSSNITCNPGIISSEGLHQVAWSGLQRDIIPFTMAPASPTHHIQDPLLALTDSGILGFVTYNLKFTRQQDIGKLKFAGFFRFFLIRRCILSKNALNVFLAEEVFANRNEDTDTYFGTL